MKKLEEAIKEKERKEQIALKNLHGSSGSDDNKAIVFEVKNTGELEILDTIDLTGDVINIVTTQPPNKDAGAFDLVNNIMEEQLTCSICSELFISAMTLNCTHTFCQFCIFEWTKKSKDCPNCRTKIFSMNKSLVLDNFIEKMLENISIEQKQRRMVLIKERAKYVPTIIRAKVPVRRR